MRYGEVKWERQRKSNEAKLARYRAQRAAQDAQRQAVHETEVAALMQKLAAAIPRETLQFHAQAIEREHEERRKREIANARRRALRAMMKSR